MSVGRLYVRRAQRYIALGTMAAVAREEGVSLARIQQCVFRVLLAARMVRTRTTYNGKRQIASTNPSDVAEALRRLGE